MAYDKEGIANVLLNDGSIGGYGLVPKDFVKGSNKKDFRAENGKLAKTDVKEAKKLWETGKKEISVDTIQFELLSFDDENAEKILFEDAAIAPVYQRGKAYLQKDYVKGVLDHKFGGEFSFK
jgi:ABC-type oligopeptide transport system substrate-binding subunit